MDKRPFNWLDAIFTILLLIAGFVIIGRATNNWLIGLGVLLMLCGVVQSEQNRNRSD
jgi:general stress protein CsbA